ncbi:hypothetical protein GCM10027429_14880 [Marivirga atlantica]|jgi:predicted nuclease with TOPRIM domain|uniref:Uncharacterized protein n=1 Tax=Marivirga atlantica TaxID=1548457 RepID=A0A937AA55_9BACT|nr:hypothetical protein [Marivirga atlantica]MBL0765105.1 hypothetical protein [Marivirga atlantica]
MSTHEEFKKSSKQKLEELLAKYEEVRVTARQKASDRQEEFKRHIEELDKAKAELEEKWNRVQHFGDETAEELSNVFSASANAFSKSVDDVKSKLEK